MTGTLQSNIALATGSSLNAHRVLDAPAAAPDDHDIYMFFLKCADPPGNTFYCPFSLDLRGIK